MNENLDVNFNQAECIKEQTNIGSTIYHNVCSQTQRTVPWGTGDWVAGLFVTILAVGFAAMFYRMFKDMFKDF